MKRKISIFLSILLVGFNTVSAQIPSTAMRVESEWCTNTNLPSNQVGENLNGLPIFRDGGKFSNGLAVATGTSNPIPEGGFYAKYKIDISVMGYYDMEMMTSTLGSDWTSKYVISVNGSKDLKIEDASASRIGNGYDGNWGKYKIRIFLNEGENEIAFISRERPKLNPNASTLYLDYFELKYASNQNVFVEGENFIQRSDSKVEVAADTAPGVQISGNKFLSFSGNYTVGMPPKQAQVSVYAPQEGSYNITTGTTILGVDYTGAWSITNEDLETVDINIGNATFVGDIAGFGNVLKHYDIKTPIKLKQGYNTLTITAQPRGKDFTTYVDYLSFTRKEEVSQKIEIEAESCLNSGFWNVDSTTPEAASLSKGKSLKLDQIDKDWKNIVLQDEFKISYNFDVSKADSYKLCMAMVAANGTSMMFSPMEMQLDNGEWITFDNNNYLFESNIPNLTPVYNPANYEYLNKIYLEEGSHTISFRIREKRSNPYDEHWYYCVFDKFSLETDTIFTTLNAKAENPMLKINDKTKIDVSMFAQDGILMNKKDFSIEFNSNNRSVLDVDENGNVTALQTGNVNISVVATHIKSSTQLQVDIPLTVFSNYLGIKVHKAEIIGTDLVIEISNPINTNNPFTLIVAETSNENGYKTSVNYVTVKNIKSINPQDVTNEELHGIMPTTFKIPINSIENNITVYLWDSLNGMVSIYNDIALGGSI